jgi:polysaccharide pyruvyl transferase WcaK-like protein
LGSGPNPNERFVVVAKDGQIPPYISGLGIKCVSANLWPVLNELCRTDGIILGGGTHFHDDYNGWRYVRHLRIMLLIVALSLMSKLLRKRVLWLSMGFGPFLHPLTRWITRLGVGLCDHITVRDSNSEQEILPWTSNDKISLAFDLAALSIEESSIPTVCTLTRNDKILGVSVTSVRASKTGGAIVDYVFWNKFGAALTEVFNQHPELKVCIFVIRGGEREDDNDLSTQLYEKLSQTDSTRVELVHFSQDPRKTFQKIAECGKFIGTRLHSGILAYLAGCDLLLLSYHKKVEDFAKEIGLSCDACIKLTPDILQLTVFEKIDALINRHDWHRPDLSLTEAVARSRLSIDVLNIYEESGSPNDQVA